MSDKGGAPRTAPADVTGIGRLAGAVPGVREAVAITRHRVRTPAASGDRATSGTPVTGAASGTPVPDDRPAVSTGPVPRVPADGVGTLTEALLRAAELAPERGTTFVLRDGSTDRQTYPELLDEALRLLGGLRKAGVGRGEAVLLQCADSRAFLTGFWACVLGGFLPTPVGPAPDYTADNAVTRKLRSAWQLLGRPFVLSDTELRDGVAGLGRLWGAGAQFRTGSVAELTAAGPDRPETAHPDQPVLNLLTSGSTGTPKCVRHAHRSIVARSYATAQANGLTEHEVTLNFMPLDHVGGIVMSNVRDVLLRCEHVNALTDSLVRRPVSLLDWCDRFEITNTWAPNFAFALVNKHAAEIEAGSWDLSRLRHICNAGEAVVPRTAYRLLELLTPHGLPPSAMVPCWGMSETSSGVTYSAMDARDPAAGTVSLDPASLDGRLVTLPHGTPRAVVLADVGPPIPGVGLRIVGREGEVLPEGRVGRLQVTGDTLLLDYFENAAANAASFTDDGWFETGDLAFLRQGRLTLTGREKDMVIVNGANHPVSDIEAVVEQSAGVRPACAAVCAVRDEEADTGEILVFFVPAEDAAGDLDGTVTAIRAELARDLALRPKAVVPVTAAEFPRTASGKIQRNQLAEAYADGRFDGRQYDRRSAPDPTDDDWLLERVWTAVDAAAATPPARPVLLYAPGDSALEAQLTGLLSGERVRVLSAGQRLRATGPRHAEVDPLDPEQHDLALAHLTGSLGEPPRVLYAWGSEPTVAGTAPDGLAPARLLVALGALARAHPDAEVTVLTRHALGVSADDEVDPGRAALSGLVRSAVTEGLLASAGLVDVPPQADAAESARLALATYGTDLVAVRDGVAYAPRLRMTARAGTLGVPPEVLRPGGTCLVIGGLGGLGRIVAEYLVAALGARLLITGRTPEAELPGTDAGAVLRDLRDLGDVRYAAVDVAAAGALREAVADAETHWGRRLGLVIHAAGASPAPQWEDLSAHQLGRESVPWLRTMLHSKLEGGAAVEELLDSHPDTGVVLFSSVNGFLGGSAYGAYAAANAALDGFAHRWAAGGRYVRCLAWSMWAGVGMNDGSPLVAAAQRRGLRLIEPSDGLGLLLAALNQPRPYLLIGPDPGNPHLAAHLAPDQFAGGSTVVAVVPEDCAEPETVRSAVAAALSEHGVLAQVLAVPRIARDAGGSPDVVRILAHRDGAARPSRYVAPQGATEAVVARVFQEQLKQGPVGREDSVFALGGDSIQVLQMAGSLGEYFGRELPARLLYVHPTVRELATAIDDAGAD